MTFKVLGQRSKLQFHLQTAEGIAEIISSFRFFFICFFFFFGVLLAFSDIDMMH